ncbi:MAG TPA: response regulator transcription factor [Steroidobacteraceae bacterium]|nr:response regulator transcription factor [Steroidobacteraceae bacterium]
MTAPARIAIVEDSADLLDELMFFLRARGYSVWGVGNAEAFWKQLHRDPVDIVLLDIGLPGEDGFSVLEFLHGLAEHCIVVMTARGGRQDQLRGLDLGADVYLIKPVNFAQLARTLDQLWSRMQRQPGLRPLPVSGRWSLAGETLSSPSGESVPLTPQEQGVVEALLRSVNEICGKEQLHRQLFGSHVTIDLHRIDVIVSRLRNKARHRGISLPIRTVFGRGFVFVDHVT